MVEIEQILNKISIDGMIRAINFYEFEFNDGAIYGRNNLEEIKEVLLQDFECSAEEIIDMLYHNQYFNQYSQFFYTNGKYIEDVKEDEIKDIFSIRVIDNISNGELREIIEDEIGETIIY